MKQNKQRVNPNDDVASIEIYAKEAWYQLYNVLVVPSRLIGSDTQINLGETSILHRIFIEGRHGMLNN